MLSVLMTCICLFALLSAPCIFLAAYKQKRYEETIPLAFFSMAFVLFTFGLFGALRIGVWMLLVLAVLCYAVTVLVLIRSRDWAGFRKRVLTPGSVLFTLCFIVLLIANYGKQAYRIDEFTHWMDVVKAMTFVDDFSTNPAANCAYGTYPPHGNAAICRAGGLSAFRW